MRIANLLKPFQSSRRRRLNIYRHRFTAICPNNGATISYELRLSTPRTIFVEDIQAACAEQERGYHENIADSLSRQLGGFQVLRAIHHGTEICSWRTGR